MGSRLVKILVVEDNQKFARFVMQALSEEGHVADHVADGTTAMTQASERRTNPRIVHGRSVTFGAYLPLIGRLVRRRGKGK